ncbi:MAG: dihydrofolate reductase [Bacteroidales bacterium]|nr:dihydrofolate reductase [Bacteroidales bacterium]
MKKSLIVAVAENNVIGNENKMLWYLPVDLKYFKEKTTGHHIIMGRKTFESIANGKALPNRTSVVITHKEDYTAENCLIVHSLEEAFSTAAHDSELFIIGGGNIYKQTIDMVDTLYITQVHETFEGDTFFPEIDLKIWKCTSSKFQKADEKNKFDCTFVVYERI